MAKAIFNVKNNGTKPYEIMAWRNENRRNGINQRESCGENGVASI
jgi:hypothetical protein